MSEHYFSQKPQSTSSPKTWRYELKGKVYTFISDVGVFSKSEVDFGSHLLIEEFQPPAIDGDFLDLGCGYGPIGIVVADCHKERYVVMAVVNERAVAVAEKNATQNNVNNVVCIHSYRFSEIKEREFAVVLLNPPIRAGKEIVHKIFEESHASLRESGELWVVIQKNQGAPSAKRKLEEVFGE